MNRFEELAAKAVKIAGDAAEKVINEYLRPIEDWLQEQEEDEQAL